MSRKAWPSSDGEDEKDGSSDERSSDDDEDSDKEAALMLEGEQIKRERAVAA